MTLFDLKVGETATIDNVNGNEKLTKRLLALGTITGTEIKLINKAPLGDPLMFNLRGFNLALRKKDAKSISIKELHNLEKEVIENEDSSVSW